jgi:tetratricopeptide (TPR) repeat protein
VLATVGGVKITRAEVQRRLDELPEPYRTNYSTPEGRQQFLDRLIEERVWLTASRKHGVDRRPEVRRQIEQTERDLLIRTYVNELMAANPAPSDSEALAYYDAHVADYRTPATVTMSHIMVKSEGDAKKAAKSARGKQDWKKLVEKFSTDSVTRAGAGTLGTVTREGNFASIGAQPALAESAYALGTAAGPGAIGGPWQSGRGWHVVKVDAVKSEGQRPFEQVKALIVRQLGQSRTQDYYRARLAEEKVTLGLSVDSSAVRDFVSQKKTAQQLFREGQEAGNPAARIAAYRRLLQEYPDSDISPQAQFMIGFVYSEELKNFDEAESAFRELLRRYPKSELAESARWMLEHMRSDDAPALAESDSTGRATTKGAVRRPADKP